MSGEDKITESKKMGGNKPIEVIRILHNYTISILNKEEYSYTGKVTGFYSCSGDLENLENDQPIIAQ